MDKKIVAFIPVRGGSKSIPLKNIKELNGRPLVYWSIDAAVESKDIDEVYVSTDSEKIREVVLNYDRNSYGKLKCIGRDPANATDNATTESVLLEFAIQNPADVIILIQATSPLLQPEHLHEALQKYSLNKYNSLLSVVRQKRFIWNVKEDETVVPFNYSPERRPRRQEFNGYLVENGAFYITERTKLLATKIRISGRVGFYEMPEEAFLEIDEPNDWLIIEQLIKKMNPKTNLKERISNLKMLATDCDGVLTDAGMYYSHEGDLLKKFNTKDGMGFSLLKQQGIILAILTGENSGIVKKRAEKLGIEDVYLDCKNKLAAMEELLKKYNLTFNDVGYVGDDINDLNLLNKVGVSFSVEDAVEEVKKSVDYVSRKKGGSGALREIADLILAHRV
ncbi:acylneuraminate cytidylyltransferase [Bacillus sp. S/N-304-OC-R1]|uniref:acylneuraminate cytidylyltransferase n=1 Tax=Bacillus sp. S/N-304-OC-R1 TaxID=2758034 RepID=UPI001C8D1125|nr:acylneuraminate cytidylyltransferase [Bacillus sp. S/N-304-OC-R1]MBY0123459.1 acylneuraminate cytidylyltransferase [Bacillus sp. S/N-304-OC-R1]